MFGLTKLTRIYIRAYVRAWVGELSRSIAYRSHACSELCGTQNPQYPTQVRAHGCTLMGKGPSTPIWHRAWNAHGTMLLSGRWNALVSVGRDIYRLGSIRRKVTPRAVDGSDDLGRPRRPQIGARARRALSNGSLGVERVQRGDDRRQRDGARCHLLRVPKLTQSGCR